MFNLFRRRGRSSKEEKQTKDVAKLDEIAAKPNVNNGGEEETDVESALKHGARASDPKVNLDSTLQAQEMPRRFFASYHQYGDGVVVNETSTNSRNDGADRLGRASDNDNAQDQSNNTTTTGQSEKSAKQVKAKSQTGNRRSLFFRHFQSQPSSSEHRYTHLDEDQLNSLNEPAKVQVEPESSTEPATIPPPPPPPPPSVESQSPPGNNSKPKRFNPIEKGREIFNEILMAKGRHRNQRGQHHKGGRQASKTNLPPQDSKQSPEEIVDSTSKSIPEPSVGGQHTYQESKNISDQQTPDGAVAVTLTNVVSVLSSATAAQCADSSDKNSPATAQPPNKEHEHEHEHKEENDCEQEKRALEIIDATSSESSSDDQTVHECASQQVPREKTPDEEIIEKQTETVDTVTTAAEAGETKTEVEEKDQSAALVTSTTNAEDPCQRDERNLSELTECDRDRLIGEHKENMGQSQAKSEESPSATATATDAPASNSRSQSPRAKEFRESYIEEQKPPEVSLPQFIVPQIIVEDFGNVILSGISERGEIFYDSVPTQSDTDYIEDHLLKVPEEGDQDDEDDDDNEEDDEDDDDEDEEDQWHFINNVQQTDMQSPDSADATAANYQKTENSSDSNLSTSDSGIATSDPTPKVLHLDSCDLVNDRGKHPPLHNFRDGSATDCEENLPQCEDFDYYKNLPSDTLEVVVIDERDTQVGIIIESISLPDVVVESTTVHSSNNLLKNPSSDSETSAQLGAGSSCISESDNFDSSGSVKMGNVHFIPIRVEKRRSFDDSVLMAKSASGGNSLYNGQQYNEEKSTLEITPEEDDQQSEESGRTAEPEEQTRDLVDQESRFSTQLDDAQKNIYNLQSKVSELQQKIDELEKDLSVKTWNVDRLQGELGAAHKEDECVRRRLRLLEEEKTTLRQKYYETEEELKNKHDDLDRQYKELEEKYKELQTLASSLETQLDCARTEVEDCRKDTEALRQEKDEQLSELAEALTTAKAEQEALQVKWRKEFETLRTQNADREDHIMSDCEWQLRQMQKNCKEKLDKAEHQRKEAIESGQKIQQEADEKLNEVIHLKSYEAEVKQLRGLTADQENSISSMREQIEALKSDLVTANENLEEQIECVRRIKYQCDNAIYDKERELLQKIDEVRNEAAARWENKLLTEMTRLKMELESVYADERREELDKLQAEHIEELKALTSRYTANEEELRAEISELRESLKQRNEEFMDLREKSDSAILQTRMHLDRADRDYQTAMCREEERREQLAETLRNEFEAEKLEMEEKFRERLGQVQDEFNKELQMSTQELTEKHQKEMEQQWQRLIAEKEEAIQELEVRHRKKLEDAEKRLHDTETRHQHDLADLKIMYDTEKTSLDKRDMSNIQEIEQLHRKCRCLTNLFEEMRMRYERRDPRPEDLREIAELRSRCEAQERDIYELTDRLREMQIQMEELQNASGGGKKKSQVRKPPPKLIPTNCDVIYEENEERESPPPVTSANNNRQLEDENADEEDGDGDGDDENDEDDVEDDEDEEDEDEDDDDDDDDVDSVNTQYHDNTINDDDSDHPSAKLDNEKTKTLNLLNDTIIENDYKQIIEADECKFQQ